MLFPMDKPVAIEQLGQEIEGACGWILSGQTTGIRVTEAGELEVPDWWSFDPAVVAEVIAKHEPKADG